MITCGRSIDGVDGLEEIFNEALTNFCFFFLVNALFSSSLSSRALFSADIGSGMGMPDKGVVAIGFPGCLTSLGGGVSEVGSGKPSVGMTSVEGFAPMWAVDCGLKMVTEVKKKLVKAKVKQFCISY